MLNEGDIAPDFELPDADIEIAKLDDFRGKPLVLFFYVRDDTPGCTTEAIEFSDLEPRFTKLGCTVLGVSRDDCIRHGAFRDKHGITVRLLADKEGVACQAYDVLVNREVDGVERIGVNRSTFVIDAAGVVRHARHGVIPKGHANEILNLVKEL
jgi:peroxiredoxin Q/BCP